jgi:polar amino acid transport system substrate-binding protein
MSVHISYPACLAVIPSVNMSNSSLRRWLFCLSLCTATSGHAAQIVVLYGDSDYPPYSYVENGRFTGIYVDMLHLAASALAPQFVLELRPLPWKRGLAEMENGRAFGLFPPGLKKERAYISTYSLPLYRETVVLFCNDKVMKTPRAKFPQDFVGLTVGVNAGFLLSARLIDAANLGLLRLAPATGTANLEKLARGRIDCYASDRGAALYSVKRLRTTRYLRTFVLREAVELSGEYTYIGYSNGNNPAYKADFIEKMNAAIESLHKSGASTRIERDYLR